MLRSTTLVILAGSACAAAASSASTEYPGVVEIDTTITPGGSVVVPGKGGVLTTLTDPGVVHIDTTISPASAAASATLPAGLGSANLTTTAGAAQTTASQSAMTGSSTTASTPAPSVATGAAVQHRPAVIGLLGGLGMALL